MYTVYLLLIPLVGALLAGLSNKTAYIVALLACVAELALFPFLINGATNVDAVWIPAFNVHFNVGIDGISMVMVMLSVLALPLIILSSQSHHYKNKGLFYSLILLMQAGMLGVFVAKDAFLFYVCYELALVPIYFIAGMWGDENRLRVTLKFFIYTLFGSLFMLAAIIFLYSKAHTFNLKELQNITLTAPESTFVFWSFFLAFAVKMPIFPFHSWQPETYTSAPYTGTMLLSGIMLKMGIYGIIRMILPIVPSAVNMYGTVAIVLCIIGIIYGGIIAIQQKDLKTLIAFSSLSHVGLIGAGVFAGNAEGLQGAVIQMFNHGINVIGMFMLIDIIERITGTRLADSLGGLAKKRQSLAIFFMIVLLGSVGLPLTNGFIGEFTLLLGVFKYNAWLGILAGTTIIIGAVYMLNMYRHIFFGDNDLQVNGDMTVAERISLSFISILIIVVGLFPIVITWFSADSVNTLISGLSK